jgi:hypothetical protein
MDPNFKMDWRDMTMKAPNAFIRHFLVLLHDIKHVAAPVQDPEHSQTLFVAQSPAKAVEWARKFLSEEEWRECSGGLAKPVQPRSDDLGDGDLDDEDLAQLDADLTISSQLMLRPQPSIASRNIPDSDAVSTSSDTDPSPQNSPKRRRLSPTPDAPAPPAAVSGSQLVYTVSSKNRDRLRRRQKKLDRAAAKAAALSSTQVADEDADDDTDDDPDPDEEMGDAGNNKGKEKSVVADDDGNRELTSVLPGADTAAEEKIKDAMIGHRLPVLSWIMRAHVPGSKATKKFLSQSGHITYKVADQMIQKAEAIGSLPALEDWQTISQHWRTNGTLTSINLYTQDPASSQAVALPTHLDDQRPEVKAFYLAFQAANQSEVNILLQAIFHRRILADLYKRYRSAESVITPGSQHGVSRGRGVTDVTEVKLQLFRALYPEYAEIHRPGDDPRSKKKWSHFGKQLDKGRRWYEVESRLGAGILAFIPEAVVSHTWVERGLPWDVFSVWLDLVAEHNQGAVVLGEQMLARLGDALAGRQIPVNRLRLEKIKPAELKDVDDKSTLLEEIDAEVDFSTDDGEGI